MANGDAELEALADGVADMIRSGGLGARSAWALRAALDAADTDGIAGVLAFKISAKSKERPDVMFAVGSYDVIQRWGA